MRLSACKRVPLKTIHCSRGKFPPARVPLSGRRRTVLAVLATPSSDADCRMAEESPSIQPKETVSGNAFATGAGPSENLEFHRSTLASRVAISHAALCDNLQRAVVEAALRGAESLAGLRGAVYSFTDALENEGLTPEAVLVVLKTVINKRSFLVIRPHLSDWTGDALRETISTWCIKDFPRERIA